MKSKDLIMLILVSLLGAQSFAQGLDIHPIQDARDFIRENKRTAIAMPPAALFISLLPPYFQHLNETGGGGGATPYGYIPSGVEQKSFFKFYADGIKDILKSSKSSANLAPEVKGVTDKILSNSVRAGTMTVEQAAEVRAGQLEAVAVDVSESSEAGFASLESVLGIAAAAVAIPVLVYDIHQAKKEGRSMVGATVCSLVNLGGRMISLGIPYCDALVVLSNAPKTVAKALNMLADDRSLEGSYLWSASRAEQEEALRIKRAATVAVCQNAGYTNCEYYYKHDVPASGKTR